MFTSIVCIYFINDGIFTLPEYLHFSNLHYHFMRTFILFDNSIHLNLHRFYTCLLWSVQKEYCMVEILKHFV